MTLQEVQKHHEGVYRICVAMVNEDDARLHRQILACIDIQRNQRDNHMAALGSIVDHWENTPNDIKGDPGCDGLRCAINKARQVLLDYVS